MYVCVCMYVVFIITIILLIFVLLSERDYEIYIERERGFVCAYTYSDFIKSDQVCAR